MTLVELRTLADVDVRKREQGVLLRWSLLHAEWHGRHVAAERRLKMAEDKVIRWQMETVGARVRSEVYGEQFRDKGADTERELHAAFSTAAQALQEAAEGLKLCELVTALLARPMKQADQRPPLRAVEGGKR